MLSRLSTLPDWNPEQIDPLGIKRVESDSRRVLPGDAFLAFRGEFADGRAFIPMALANGAQAVLWDPADGFVWNPAWQVANLAVPDLRQRAGIVASHVAQHPSRADRKSVV